MSVLGIKSAIAVCAAVFVLNAAVAENDSGPALAMRLLQEGNVLAADSLAGRLATGNPSDPYVAYLYSMTRYEAGAYAQALEQAHRSLDNLPAVSSSLRAHLVDNAAYLDSAVAVLKDFRKVEGTHFDFFFKNPRDSILAADIFSVLEAARDRLGEDLGYHPPDRIRIEVYPDRASFITVSTLTEDEVNRTGTVALCKFNRMLITSPRVFLRGYGWQETLCHEYAHFIIHRIGRGRVPIWLHEALAHFEEVRFTGAKSGALTLLEQDLLYRALRDNKLVPFAKMHPSMAKLKDAEESGTAFAEVLMAASYIVDRAGYAGIQALLKGCAEGKSLDSLLPVIAKSNGPFEPALFDYIRSKNFKPVEGVSVL
ncbi:MAG: hypothetical protein V1913_03080, partial [Fibrobacterota bacterium]